MAQEDQPLEHECDPLNPMVEWVASVSREQRRQRKYNVGPPERLTSPLQTQLTPSDCGRFYKLAGARFLTPSALLRVIVLEWMEKQEAVR